MKENILDRERDKFRDSNGLSKIAVILEQTDPIPAEIVESVFTEIIKSSDRQRFFTFFDAGNKNERIEKIEYKSPSTHPGLAAIEIFTYNFINNNYVLSASNRSLLAI
jgi:hypothetical protein